MKLLSRESFAKAQLWIEANARPLEKALFKFHLDDGAPDQVVDELITFQNSDGGFGNGIEPDLRTSHSSVLGTSLAFQVLRSLKVDDNKTIVKSAIEFLLNNFNEKDQSWRIIPLEAQESPHAPWWNQVGRERNFEGFHLNPTSEILGYLYDYKEIVPASLISGLTLRVLDKVSRFKKIEMHDFLCCKRLLESNNLIHKDKQKLQAELSRLISSCVLKDSLEWSGYGLRPLQIADSPNSPFMGSLKALVENNLDYEIDQQEDKGVWSPTWSWNGNFPNEWEDAKREWTGILTLDRLLLLKRFNRLD